jgi:transposase
MKHRVELTSEQRSELRRRATSGKAPARELLHAQVLLKVDGRGPRLTDAAAARETGLSARTVARVRERFAREGLDAALGRRPQPPRPQKRALSDAAEARLVALACSEAPEGHARWSVRLLAERAVELGIVEERVGRESVRQALKKTRPSPGGSSAG